MDREAWALAYHRQAVSDWRMYQRLALDPGVEACHALHYLQMATEKLAKAYHFRDRGTSTERLLTEHVGFQRFVAAWLYRRGLRARAGHRPRMGQATVDQLLLLARQVERLAPAVDRLRTPSNSEYPWDDGSAVVTPADYGFPELSLLREPLGGVLLNLIREAIRDF